MKSIIRDMGIIFMATICLSACTGAFEDIKTNPKGVTDEDLKQDNNYVGMHFMPMQQSIYFNKGNGVWEYQLIQNLNADIYSGYMATASPTISKAGMNMYYALNHDWNDYCWNYAYNEVMSPSLQITKKCEADMETYTHFEAINTICRVLTMSRLCDQYGPIIYSKYGDSMTGGSYDSAEDTYALFFQELTDASATLKEAMSKGSASFAAFDMVYGGDLSKWAKMANSLRLRLAMRIVKANPTEAQKQFEAAFVDENGLILSNDENFIISGTIYKHPLATLTSSWRDIFLNANVSSILGGYDDPRLQKMVKPTQDGLYIGVRSGITGLDNHPEYKEQNIVSELNIADDTPAMLFPAAETYFLLAEAALRGWNVSGTAQNYYEQGIQVSFQQWGVELGNYLSNTNKPADFVDVLDPVYNIAAVETATPKWEDALSKEEQLRKIIVQKWIACFPEGMNAWAEYRRTGYPVQFPIMRNDSQGDQYIPDELGVRRLTYTISERDNNPEGYSEALEMLGGPDSGATRIFWDVDAPNI